MHYGPGVDPASNRNEHKECFLGVKTAGAYGWQLYHLHVPITLKSGSLNFLEPSGPAQTCNGIVLPLPLFGYLAYVVCFVAYKYISHEVHKITTW
jgi:hypothetical protein